MSYPRVGYLSYPRRLENVGCQTFILVHDDLMVKILWIILPLCVEALTPPPASRARTHRPKFDSSVVFFFPEKKHPHKCPRGAAQDGRSTRRCSEPTARGAMAGHWSPLPLSGVGYFMGLAHIILINQINSMVCNNVCFMV
jgi:hypothetical protein